MHLSWTLDNTARTHGHRHTRGQLRRASSPMMRARRRRPSLLSSVAACVCALRTRPALQPMKQACRRAHARAGLDTAPAAGEDTV